jgi:hypothetical protein
MYVSIDPLIDTQRATQRATFVISSKNHTFSRAHRISGHWSGRAWEDLRFGCWAVCRFHGARGGGPRGKGNGMFKHGLYTQEAVKERHLLRRLLRQSRKALSIVPDRSD